MATQRKKRRLVAKEPDTLHLAITRYDEAGVQRLLQLAPHTINTIDEYGRVPLELAVQCQQLPLLARLLACPALDVNKSSKYFGTALSHACIHGYVECVRMLLTNPTVDINIPDAQGDTPLSDALVRPDLTCATLLLARPEVQLNVVNKYDKTALWRAAYHGRPRALQALLARPDLENVHRKTNETNVISRLHRNKSALDIAILRQFWECVTLLFPPPFWHPQACFACFFPALQQQVGLGWQLTWEAPPLWRTLPLELVTLLLTQLVYWIDAHYLPPNPSTIWDPTFYP